MNVTVKEWSEYRDTLENISNKASEEFVKYFRSNAGASRDDIIQYANALVTKYGEASAEMACEFYDEMARISGKYIASAVPADVSTYSETAKAINGSFNQSPLGNMLDGTIKRLVKQPASDTTLKNALRDEAEFAWIPSGDTCAFCLMLASNGWQRASKNIIKGGHASHIHSNCNCEFGIRFDEKTNYDSYDPDKYLKIYNDADGDLNQIRQEQYEKNKDKINEQKRELYRLNKEA